MYKFFENNWTIVLSVMTVIVSLVAQWALLGYRITAVEQRQDRQGSAITDIQTTLSSQAAEYAALEAKIDAISDNVDYIRSRIDNIATK